MVIDWIAGADQFRPNTFGKKDDIGIIKAKAAELVGPDLVRDTSASFFELDEGALAYFNEVDQTVEPDSHVTFVPFYKVCMYIRDLPRFFNQVGHRTTNASIENKHFFTK